MSKEKYVEPGYSYGQATVVKRKIDWDIVWFEVHGHSGKTKFTIDGLRHLQKVIAKVLEDESIIDNQEVRMYESDNDKYPELRKNKSKQNDG